MKKHLFLLGTFMTSSLVTANTLLVISCKKKVIIKDTKEDEKNTAEKVEAEKAIKLRDAITNIIDVITTNPIREDWWIDLNDENFDKNEIVNSLNKAVEPLKGEVENNQITLDQVESLQQELKDKINQKFASLKDLIIHKIEALEDQLGISKFEFNFKSDSIAPVLTNLTAEQIIQAIAKLNQQSNPKSVLSDPIVKHLGYAVPNEKDFELFKVKTDLTYNFKFASTTFSGEYKDTELLLTGNSDSYEELASYSHKTISKIINEDKAIRNVEIYSSDNEKIKDYEYIGKKMDWDFSKKEVQDEIESIQIKQLKEMSENAIFKGNLEFKPNDIEFEDNSFKYMKFTNHDMDIKRLGEDNILIYNGIDKQTSKEVTNKINDKEEALEKIKEQFEFDGNDSSTATWNGGKINHDFIAQAKKDGEKGEGKNPIINLDKYYGLGSTDKHASILIGYVTTTIRKPNFAGMSIPKIAVHTNITAQFESKMKGLYDSFKQYVGEIVHALHDDTIRVIRSDPKDYSLQWKFDKDQIDLIINEMNKAGGDGTVTFDWIMQNILYTKLTTGENANLLPTKYVPIESQSFLNSDKEIKYVQWNNISLNVHKSYVYNSAPLYVKYGPFVVYLAGDDATTTWSSRPNDYIITQK